MKKETQAQRNPFPYSDTNKRYHTFDYYAKRTFGGKVSKIMLDGGFTCPNIDGRCGVGGCIYCSGKGSGDFAGDPRMSITSQMNDGIAMMQRKWQSERLIAYFQAHTNTYAPASVLAPMLEEALGFSGVVGINIATRADCLESDIIDLLEKISARTVLTVELGLQTVHDRTADLINRGHSFLDFCEGYEKLRSRVPRASICVHLIHGLPYESREDMLVSVDALAAMRPDQVKIHLLHVLEGTRLAEIYRSGEYSPLERDEYIDLVCDSIERLPPETVISRLTGDGAPNLLLAPEWSRKKVTVINDIDKELYRRGTYQGIYFKG